ncbi:hypothetical protein V6N13_086930 [Hibiscus sabdariffa]
MDVDSQPTMEETILVGDDLMMGPPSPVVPQEIASHVLEGIELCDGILRNLFLCLQINDIEPFCQDELALYRQCAEKRDKEIRERLQDSERKLGLSMPFDQAKERVGQLESEVTSLERRLILASGMEGIEGFRQRWSLHGRLTDTKKRLESLKLGVENRKVDEPSKTPTGKRWVSTSPKSSNRSFRRTRDRSEMANEERDKTLRKIADAFKELAASVNSQTTDIEVAPFSRACSFVSPLFGCLGIAFKFAEMDYVAKVSDLAEASKSIATLNAMLDRDIEGNCVRKAGSHTRNLLRVKRGIDMVRVLFEQILATEGDSLKDPASKAYAQVFAPHHGWVIRKAVAAGMYALPTKAQLMKKLNEDEASARIQMQNYVAASGPHRIMLYIDKLFLSRELGVDCWKMNWVRLFIISPNVQVSNSLTRKNKLKYSCISDD